MCQVSNSRLSGTLKFGVSAGEAPNRFTLKLLRHAIVQYPNCNCHQQNHRCHYGHDDSGAETDLQTVSEFLHVHQGFGKFVMPNVKSTFISPISGTLISVIWLGSLSCHALSL